MVPLGWWQTATIGNANLLYKYCKYWLALWRVFIRNQAEAPEAKARQN
jgi:hypothetical protein